MLKADLQDFKRDFTKQMQAQLQTLSLHQDI